MSLHFVSGKPGGGKSLYSMSLLQEELLHGQRVIVTNLPLNLGTLNEYLTAEFPERTFNLHERIRVLSDETETGQFWLYRWPSQQIAAVSEEDWKKGERYQFGKPIVDVGEVDRGCLFIIDEIHLFFNSREWMNTGKGCLFYLSQHRKLGDDVIAVTQSIGNVDKQFRSLAQDFSYIRNLKKERKGVFRLPGFFIRSTYSQPFTGQPGVEPMEVRTFTLQPTKLASCYNTAAGVGVLGRSGADRTERVKGLPWWVMILIVVAACGAVAMMPTLLARGVGAVGKSSVAAATAVAPAGVAFPGGIRTSNAPSKRVLGQRSASNSIPDGLEQPKPVLPELVGYYFDRGVLVALLSDGSERSTGVERVDRSGAVVDGQRLRWARPAPAVPDGRTAGPVHQTSVAESVPEPAPPKVRVTFGDGQRLQNY